jgi:putative membrane protein (TIGR04086 family)
MQKDNNSFSQYIYSFLFTTVLASVICAVLLAIISILALKVDIPLASLPFIMNAVAGISVFSGVFFTARKVRNRGFFLGLCTGILFFTVMLLVSAFSEPMGVGISALIKLAVCLIFGILGGVLGVNSKEKALPL